MMQVVDDEYEEEESDMNELLYVKNANEGNMYAIYNTLWGWRSSMAIKKYLWGVASFC